MAEEAVVQTEISFETDAQKAEAISSFDESKGKPEELTKLMEAPVKPKATEPEPDKAEVQPQVEAPAKEEPVEPPAETAQPPQGKEEFDWAAWAKERGYKTPGEARKAFDERKKFIEAKFAEKPQNASSGYETLAKKTQELEARLAALSTPAATAPTEVKVQTAVSKIETVKQSLNNNLLKKRELITQLKGDSSLAYDPDFLEKQQAVEEEKYGLDMQLVDEINNLRSVQETASQRFTDFTKSREEDTRREQGQRMYESEMSEINALRPMRHILSSRSLPAKTQRPWRASTWIGRIRLRVLYMGRTSICSGLLTSAKLSPQPLSVLARTTPRW
jgi:hypothetical protein